jgi:hypothetical protein
MSEIVVAPSASAAETKLTVGSVFRKRSAFSRKLKFFNKDSARLRELLTKLGSDAEEVKDLNNSVLTYRLVRNLVVTYNWTKMKKEDDKRVVPEELQAELMGLYGTDQYSKVVEALKLPSAEVTKVLPEKLDAKLVEAILKWVDQKEKAVITDLEKVIEECSTEITARKDEPKPAKKKSPRAASKKEGKEGAPEAKFRDLMNQVREKVKKIKLGQNDFQVYSETQEQIDALLYEATEEIMKIKKTLKTRFAKAQKSSSRSRKPRGEKESKAAKAVEVEA